MNRRLLTFLFIGLVGSSAFVIPTKKHGAPFSAIHTSFRTESFERTLSLMAKRDVSRSGTKRKRLDRLAELEEERIETDKGFVLQAAGGFVALIILLLAFAASTGVLDKMG